MAFWITSFPFHLTDTGGGPEIVINTNLCWFQGRYSIWHTEMISGMFLGVNEVI